VSDGNLLVHGGYVLTLDSAGDIPGGDVHVRDGVIQSIGTNLDIPEASLAPGKRADLIVVSVDAPNLGVFTDPARLLVTAASPRDVDLVIADGRVLERDGVLAAVDVRDVTGSARAALAGGLRRAAAG